MRVLEVTPKIFKTELQAALDKNGVRGFNAIHVLREAEARMERYLADIGEDEDVYSNNFLVTMGEVMLILRNNHIHEELEAFIVEELGNRLEQFIEDNPYL